MKKTTRKPDGFGRIRICDDSLTHAGINKGDVTLIKLGGRPVADKLCAAFTPWGDLVIRYYYKRPNGDIILIRGEQDEVLQVFAPGAVMVFGPVVGVERGGGGH